MRESQFRRRFLLGAVADGAAGSASASAAGPFAKTSIYSVADFDAPRNGRDPDTRAIQSAIDTCHEGGGGTVYFPAGAYLSGGLMLKSRVHLYLEAGAVLRGSTNLEDFPKTIPQIRSYTDNYTERSLIFGEELENVGIHGDGVLDGQGAVYEGPYLVRPYMIRLVSCKDVSVTGVTIRDSPMWVQHYLACDDVSIHGITVHSLVNKNNDGIDIDGCERVTISDCNISSGDDAIVLKSTLDRTTRDVSISNCVLSSHCNAFKLGTESNGGFENIVLSNCTMYDTRISGIAVECVDGGTLDGVSISNVIMRNVRNPIFIRLGTRNRPFEAGRAVVNAATLRNVSIRGVRATGADSVGCPISGVPGHSIENLSIQDVSIVAAGGVKDPPADAPEVETGYPEYRMFGTLPAYGFYCRHVKGLRLHNVETGTAGTDERPALVCDDVEDLDISGSTFTTAGTSMRFKNVRGGLIQGCRLRETAAVFLDAGSGSVSDVYVAGNDLSKARQDMIGPASQVEMGSNRRRG